MKGEAKRLADFLSALVIEKVVLEIVPNSKPRAASRVGRSVYAVRASYASGESRVGDRKRRSE